MLIGLKFLQWLALDAGYDAGNEPARQAHLDHGYQRAILVQNGQASARVIRILHGRSPSIGSQQRRWIQFPRRLASLLAGLSPAGMAASLAARSFATEPS